jgi:hypothetical protein
MLFYSPSKQRQELRDFYYAAHYEGGRESSKAPGPISYSITREKAPIYTMGSADVRAYSRNKRGIAGSLIWINFDRHALLNLFHKARGKFVADTDEIRPQYQTQDAPDANAIFSSSIVRSVGVSVSDTIDKLDSQVNDIYGMNELAEPWYADQILPFDITLAGANEYGAMASAKIFGVEILKRRGRRRQRRRRDRDAGHVRGLRD